VFYSLEFESTGHYLLTVSKCTCPFFRMSVHSLPLLFGSIAPSSAFLISSAGIQFQEKPVL